MKNQIVLSQRGRAACHGAKSCIIRRQRFGVRSRALPVDVVPSDMVVFSLTAGQAAAFGIVGIGPLFSTAFALNELWRNGDQAPNEPKNFDFEPPQDVGIQRNIMWAFPSFSALMPEEAGPKTMPRSAKLLLLAAFPISLLWYLWYKFCIEEELKLYTKKPITDGYFGGYLVVLPFMFGTGAGILHGDLTGIYGVAFWGAFAWIYLQQWFLYNKVNELYAKEGLEEPIQVWWLFLLFGPNLVAGLRQIHFLANFWALKRGEEPRRDEFAELFPFVKKPTLTLQELGTRPDLWLAAFAGDENAEEPKIESAVPSVQKQEVDTTPIRIE